MIQVILEIITIILATPIIYKKIKHHVKNTGRKTCKAKNLY